MPRFEREEAVLHYDEFARGFPILALGPDGLQSTITAWTDAGATINPITEFTDRFSVIAMDQRNASDRSRAPISVQDGWHTFTDDHVALLDHLEIERCHVYGHGIGVSFILSLLRARPYRIVSAVLARPIGRLAAELPPRTEGFNAWAASIAKDHPEATESVLDALYRSLYAPGFAYSIHPNLVSTIGTPCLVLAGSDETHPMAISEALAKRLPNCQIIKEWKSGEALASTRARVRDFFLKHTP